jgi:transcriptional regulator with XRE-family HTH domain
MPTTTSAVLSTVKAEMARRGITQATLAPALGISTAGVSSRLNGHTPLRVDELIKIAATLDVDVSVLVATPDTRRAMRQAS